MDRQSILKSAEQAVKHKLEGEGSGHDWWHIYRVKQTAVEIAKEEKADVFVCELAALLHDMVDEKLNDDVKLAWQELREWFAQSGTESRESEQVLDIIGSMSFKGGGRPPMKTLEGQIVQDADRLDAIGAIGIARVFAYSGWKSRPIHDPAVRPRETLSEQEYRSGNDTAVNHFFMRSC